MRVIQARNVHESLIFGLDLLAREGQERESRNGPVKVMPCPVTTVYEKPCERVVFWPERDANPFFHLYEALWMLDGRNDVAPLVRYTKNIINYSDDGHTMHGAYGHRWRSVFLDGEEEFDQLEVIVERLTKNPDDRRCVLQMWDCVRDLWLDEEAQVAGVGKDFPCNTVASFQRQASEALDMTVFCRSNDIIWGAYGANAVHFSMLLEYMAMRIGCPVGKYYQVSVNWHAYLETFNPLLELLKRNTPVYSQEFRFEDPYQDGKVHHVPLINHAFERKLKLLLWAVDNERPASDWLDDPFFVMAYRVLKAHEVYRKTTAPERYANALEILGTGTEDWVVAAREWIQRRQTKWHENQK